MGEIECGNAIARVWPLKDLRTTQRNHGTRQCSLTVRRENGTVNLTALSKGWVGTGHVKRSHPPYRRHRVPPESISTAVGLYFRFPLSLRMVEEMLAARGISVSYETVRRKLGRTFSDQIRRMASSRGDQWHLDEVVISIASETYWLWRAIDQHGFVLDVLVQKRRDARAARRLVTKSLKGAVKPPRVMITDRLKSYATARKEMKLRVGHRQHKGPNNRTDNSYQPTRRRERIMKRFKSARQAQRFLSIHDQVVNLFHIPYPEHTTASRWTGSDDVVERSPNDKLFSSARVPKVLDNACDEHTDG
jgi:putative transposase